MSSGPVHSDDRSAARASTVPPAVGLREAGAPATPTSRSSSAGQPPGLLDSLLIGEAEAGRESFLDQLLSSRSPAATLRVWLRERARLPKSPTRRDVADALGRDIARLDALLNRQTNAILHHPAFQQLEASWRGLWYLTGQALEACEAAEQLGQPARMLVRILNVSKRELARDLERAVEFDQSQAWKKIYEEEFGTAGGEPFGVLIGDYEFANRVEDIELLTGMSQIAAAAFAPFVSSASPALLGLDEFATLEQPVDLTSTFQHLDYLKWRAFREREESRFVGLTLPRVLMRLPYEDDGLRRDGFRFREEVAGPDRRKYLWGSSAYAFGGVLARAYASSGWFAEIRGVERGVIGGGLVLGLDSHSFGTDRKGVAPKSSTEIAIREEQEKEISSLGLIPLCHSPDNELSVFFTNASTQKPKIYDDATATANARISAMMQYIMCASRFAHYLKISARNKVGGMVGERELEDYLNDWITQYVAPDEKAPPSTKARFPLRQAQIEVREIASKPGNFRLVMHLLPHFQLDELTASLRLVSTLSPPASG
jgi:type VI secretion system ImpC/EvpB family protein